MNRLILILVVGFALCDAHLCVTPQGLKSQPNQPATAGAEIHKKLLDQLLRDGQVSRKCAERTSEAEQMIHVETQDLNRDGKQEYLIQLMNHECSTGGTSNYMFLWCYRETPRGYIKLLAVSSDKISNSVFDHFSADTRYRNGRETTTYHNGFADLTLVSAQGPYIGWTNYTFNGTRYVESSHGVERVPN